MMLVFHQVRIFTVSITRNRSYSQDDIETKTDVDPWGWFEDIETDSPSINFYSVEDKLFDTPQPLHRALSLEAPATIPPLYILESTLETQQLWYSTAGRRPRQPKSEREMFEKECEKSEAVPSLSSLNNNDYYVEERPINEFNGEVIYRGANPFSNSVSKSFHNESISAMIIQISRFRIFRSTDGNLHAEFLVVVSIGNATFGVWKRHSDFRDLANSLKSTDTSAYKNALLSWDCVIQRKRWFKCLDTDYLALKCFLLERYMHDLLFESHSPAIMTKFLGFLE